MFASNSRFHDLPIQRTIRNRYLDEGEASHECEGQLKETGFIEGVHRCDHSPVQGKRNAVLRTIFLRVADHYIPKVITDSCLVRQMNDSVVAPKAKSREHLSKRLVYVRAVQLIDNQPPVGQESPREDAGKEIQSL